MCVDEGKKFELCSTRRGRSVDVRNCFANSAGQNAAQTVQRNHRFSDWSLGENVSLLLQNSTDFDFLLNIAEYLRAENSTNSPLELAASRSETPRRNSVSTEAPAAALVNT